MGGGGGGGGGGGRGEGGGGGGGFDVFEVLHITAKLIFSLSSQFHNCIPYTVKKSFTFYTQSHVATYFSQNCVFFPLFLQETF